MKQKLPNQLDQVSTKGDLLSMEEKIDNKLISMEEKIDNKLISMEEKIDNKAKGYRDDVLNKLDEVMGELETIREEQVLSAGQYRDHETRITNLENLRSSHQ